MSQALYRKYRSKTLDEIYGQDHITIILKNALKQGKISHAYLFSGPHGVGKTSVARILAHQLNGMAYDGEDAQLDIIEMDAASAGGVDEVRELRDKIYVAPSSGQYKVYIIDEVQMMSGPAFNALLKTLEEPPAHVVIILATTAVYKLPATVISRTQRFTFKPVPSQTIINHLKNIASSEKIKIDDQALQLIADHSQGSFRDAIGMLDQASGFHHQITRKDLEELFGIPSAQAINQLINFLSNHQVQPLEKLLAELQSDGYQAASIAKQLARTLRQSLVSNQLDLDKETSLLILTRLIDVPDSHDPQQLLEIILLEASLNKSDSVRSQSAKTTLPQASKSETAKPKSTTKNAFIEPTKKDPAQISIKPVDQVLVQTETVLKADRLAEPDSSELVTLDDSQWQSALEVLKKRYNTLYGIIKLGRSDFSPGLVKLTFGYAFHQKKANEIKNKDIMLAVLKDLTGQNLKIECLYEKESSSNLLNSDDSYDQPMELNPFVSSYDTISNIFGGGELLES